MILSLKEEVIEAEVESPSDDNDIWAAVLQPDMSRDSIEGRVCIISQPILKQNLKCMFSGDITTPEDFNKYIQRNARGPFCGVCHQFSNKSVTNVRNHVESKHFPNMFDYQCNQCEMTVGTRKALDSHRQRNHKNMIEYINKS